MTLKLEGDLDILKMYLYTKNESKAFIMDDICMAIISERI